MRKHYNIISNYFSLLRNHISKVATFNKQAKEWSESSAVEQLRVDAITYRWTRNNENSISFPEKMIWIVDKINNSTALYLEEAISLYKVLATVMNVEYDDYVM